MNSSENPYEAPITDSSTSEQPSVGEPFSKIARRVFLAWEKLRLVYIAILGAVSILMCVPSVLANGLPVSIFGVAIIGAIGANLCYFIGPSIETYVTWLGYQGKWLRTWLFGTGTVFSAVLVFTVLASILLPNL